MATIQQFQQAARDYAAANAVSVEFYGRNGREAWFYRDGRDCAQAVLSADGIIDGEFLAPFLDALLCAEQYQRDADEFGAPNSYTE